jgi:hypothetical protein
MRKPDPSELERVVAATEMGTTDGGMEATKRAQPDHKRRVSASLLTAFRQLEAGHAELARLRAEHESELRKLAEESRKTAAEGAAEAWRRLQAFSRHDRAAFDVLADEPWKPWSDILLSALFVRAWPTVTNLQDWHLEPGLNTAKFRVGGPPGGGTEKVSFYLLWQNQRDVWVEADILARIMAYGHGECHADGSGVGSWFGIVSRMQADVTAQLTLWQMWSSPATLQTVDSVPIASFSAQGGFFGATHAGAISLAPAVTATRFAIPPAGVIVIEASVVVEFSGLGSVDIDFASGADPTGFSVGLPYAVVTVPPEIHP